MSTAEIGLAVRTTNCLEERGIFTVNDLLHCTREDLLSISNFGEKTLEEVYKALEKIGFPRPDAPTIAAAVSMTLRPWHRERRLGRGRSARWQLASCASVHARRFVGSSSSDCRTRGSVRSVSHARLRRRAPRDAV